MIRFPVWFRLVLVLMIALLGVEFLSAAEDAAATPKLTGKMITLGDFGAEDLGYLVLPLTPPVGGVVIIHDRYGLDANIKQLAEQWGGKGYLAIAVDLYNGRNTIDPAQANTLLSSMRVESAMKTIQAGERLLKESPRLKVSRVAIIGYNSGGTIALLAAQQIKDVDAVAAVNPMIAPRDKKMSKYRVPIFILNAGSPPDGLAPFQKLMDEMRNPLLIYTFDGTPEGFSDPHSASYSATNTEKAWQIVDEHLRQEFAKPVKGPSIIEKVEDFFN